MKEAGLHSRWPDGRLQQAAVGEYPRPCVGGDLCAALVERSPLHYQRLDLRGSKIDDRSGGEMESRSPEGAYHRFLGLGHFHHSRCDQTGALDRSSDHRVLLENGDCRLIGGPCGEAAACRSPSDDQQLGFHRPIESLVRYLVSPHPRSSPREWPGSTG